MSAIPSPQGAWLRAVIGVEAPSEPRSSCEDCAMCGSDPLLGEEVRFHPDVKCCTYLPQLPNFSIGGLLADTNPALAEGRTRVRARIAQRLGATPLGLGPTRACTERLERANSDAGFGRDPAARCPYFANEDGGRCTIWAHRNGVCATWFCRVERAIEGQRFWRHARELLGYLESELALWAAMEVGLAPECLDALTGSDGKLLQLGRGELRVHTDERGQLSEADARRLWGRFYEDQEGFFRACGEAVAGRSWTSISAQLGARLQALSHRTQQAFAAMRTTTLPRVLRRAPLQSDELDDGSQRVTSWYALRDPVKLDAKTASGLQAFDGRPTNDVVAELQMQGVALDAATLRRLVDHGVLIASDHDDAHAIERPRAVELEDRLSMFRWFQFAEISGGLELAPDGKPVFMLRAGPQEVGFRDPELHAFAQMLIARRNGFIARDAATWGPPGRPLGWPRAQALLDKLLQGAILQRAPRSVED